jgi:hypothetical protein
MILLIMLFQELGLMSPDGKESPAKHGLVMFVAFVLCGLIPKLRTFFIIDNSNYYCQYIHCFIIIALIARF